MAQPEVIAALKDMAVRTFTCLMWMINWDKSALIPAPVIDFLGFRVVTNDPEYSVPIIKVPKEKIRQLRKDIKHILLTSSGTITARRLAQICAQCVAIVKAILPGKLMLRNMPIGYSHSVLSGIGPHSG